MTGNIRRLLAEEDGGFLANVIFIVVVIAVVAVIFLDSASVYSAYARAGEAADESARLAYIEYEDSRNLYLAEVIAQQYCEDSGLQFVAFEDLTREGLDFSVTCGSDADTIVFRYLPALKDLTHQEVTSRPQTF